MIEVQDIYVLFLIIIIFSVFQSCLGVGLLLFGTPTLIILGYSYVETLWIILPSSIVISLTQVLFDRDLIQAKKSIFLLTVPALTIGLIIILLSGDLVNVSKIVGIGLLIVASIRQSKVLNAYLSNNISSRTSIYLIFTGLIHGLSNMGGGPLSVLMSSLHNSKSVIRVNIAYVYLFFGISQIIILTIFQLKVFEVNYLVFPIVAIMSYFFIGKPLSNYIDDNKYQSFITIMVFIYGFLALIEFNLKVI
jgi:hypothetical protein|tara:strand:+ start:127 stop:873 length:747 start_codon:yes stop_codon:yes gene_type:complete